MRYLMLLIALLASAPCMAQKKRELSYLDKWVNEITSANHNEIRKRAIGEIWKGRKTLPTKLPQVKDGGICDQWMDGSTYKKAVQLRVEMDQGFVSRSCFVRPKAWNGDVIIYHAGHYTDGWRHGTDPIDVFLKARYAVLAMAMPVTNPNLWPNAVKTSTGMVYTEVTYHRGFEYAESEDFSPLKWFLHPVALAVNYVEKEHPKARIHMTGESGGGWTTAVYSALDPRIEVSAPVAGDLPVMALRMKGRMGSIQGHFEYGAPGLSAEMNLLDSMVLAGCSGKRLQILHKGDPLFPHSGAYLYDQHVGQAMNACGGTWKLHVTDMGFHGYGREAADIFLAAIR